LTVYRKTVLNSPTNFITMTPHKIFFILPKNRENIHL